jgi:hypothetical protein
MMSPGIFFKNKKDGALQFRVVVAEMESAALATGSGGFIQLLRDKQNTSRERFLVLSPMESDAAL